MKGFMTDMFKRTITAFLSILMFTMFSVTVSAADVYDLTFDISCNNKHDVTVKQGDIITVDFYMERTDKQESFDLNSYQNEIEYDKTFFELIVPDRWNFRYTPAADAEVDDTRLAGGQKVVKIAQVDAYGLNHIEWIGSFQLKVIAESGSSVVKSSRQKAKNTDLVASNISSIDLKVTIGTPYTVTYSEEIFDRTKTAKEAFEGVDYQGKILDSVYDEIYDWTVSYEIGGIIKNADISGSSFTIPKEDITGDITLDYSKQLNVRIYIEPYAPGITLVRVEGAKEGYTFAGNKMIKSANSENMGAWIIEGDINLQEAESLLGVAEDASDNIYENADISQNGKINLNDLAIVLGCSKGYYSSTTVKDVTRYLLSDMDGDREVTDSDYDEIVNAYKAS